MTKPDHTPVIAVDGGGTRCRVAVQHGTHRALAETGPANASSDLDGAVAQVTAGLAKLADETGLAIAELHTAPAFIGLAGVISPEIAARLREALPFAHMQIADDRLAAVRGVLGARDGVLAHCGTGSFFAAQDNGEIRLIGGWGPVLGDDASAQWVGRQALRLALECEDGRLDPTPLSNRLIGDFSDAAGIVRFAGHARPAEFGALAPLVTEYAAKSDALAQQIMRLGAEEIVRALRHLGWRAGLPICLTGGIGPHFAPYLPEDLRADLAQGEGDPLDGAIALALDLAARLTDDRD